MTYIFYNPLSNNKKGKSDSEQAEKLIQDKEISYFDITAATAKDLLTGLKENDTAVICGGDGTLHHFINALYDECGSADAIKANLFYYPTGSGNDFMHDVAGKNEKKLIQLRPYITDLPSVTINGKKSHFLNGVGAGLDGWCCSEVERIRRKKADKKINYTPIALRGLLYAYKPISANVIADGVEHRYTGVWILPAMNGRFFGGGMKVAPDQDRLNKEHTVSFIAAHSISRFNAAPIFPEFLTGKYVRHKKYVDIIRAKEISVTFDQPVTLQIDGEAIPGITSYQIKCI